MLSTSLFLGERLALWRLYIPWKCQSQHFYLCDRERHLFYILERQAAAARRVYVYEQLNRWSLGAWELLASAGFRTADSRRCVSILEWSRRLGDILEWSRRFSNVREGQCRQIGLFPAISASSIGQVAGEKWETLHVAIWDVPGDALGYFELVQATDGHVSLVTASGSAIHMENKMWF